MDEIEDRARTARATDALWAETEPALTDLLGAEVVDRDLCVDRRAVADLVLRGDDGLHLALAVDGRSEHCVERALDALAFLQGSPAVLARHLGLATGAAGQLLLVAVDGWSPRVLARLAGLQRAGARLFQSRRVESARGASAFLEELGARSAPAAAAAPESRASTPRAPAEPAPFEGLSQESRALALDLTERLARVDPAIELERGPDSLAWFVEGAPLCRLSSTGGRLEGHLAGSPVPHRIQSRSAAEVFLDWVLALHLEHLEGVESEEARDFDDYELVPSPRQPLLTREEIEAFHPAAPGERGS